MLIDKRFLSGPRSEVIIPADKVTYAAIPGCGHPGDQGTPGGRGLRVRLCKCSLLYALILGALAASVLVMATPRLATARPDPPVIDGSTATCTGDQHLGIASGIDFQTPPILNLYRTCLAATFLPLTDFFISPTPHCQKIVRSGC